MGSRRPLNRPLALLLAALVALATFTPSAEAQDDAYRRLAAEATQAMAEHRLDDALTLFREMHAMAPSARTLWSLGRVHYELAQYVVALDYLDQAIVDPRRALEAPALAEATSLRDRARALTAEVTASSTPSGAVVLVDDVEVGTASFRLDPGEHSVRFELAGFAPGVRRVVVRGGEQLSVSVVLTPLGGVEGGTAAPVAQREVTLEVTSIPPGLALHLQPLAVTGTGGVMGPLEEVCVAPCTHSVPSGVYGGGVVRPGSDPILAPGALSLTSDSRVEIEIVSHADVRLGFGITVGVALAYTVLGCILGGLMLDSSNRSLYDSGAGVALVTSGVTTGALGLSALIFAFIPDEAAIRVAPSAP